MRLFIAGAAMSAMVFTIALATLGSGEVTVASRAVESLVTGGGGSVAWGRVGPWGRQRSYILNLDPPAGLVTSERCRDEQPLWHFQAQTPQALAAALAGAGVPPVTRARLAAVATCEADGCRTTPDAEAVLGLSQAAHQGLHRLLIAAGGNYDQTNAFPIPGGDVGAWVRESGVPGHLGDLIGHLVYPVGGRRALADLWLVCRQATVAERTVIMRALTRARGQSVVLEIDDGADPEPLVRYWGAGGSPAHRQRVQTLLEGAARTRGGTSIALFDLLPPFARMRLNTFPEPGTPPWNCHYAALNFFAEGPPDDGFTDEKTALAALAADFAPVPLSEIRFGDLVLLRNEAGKVVHSGVYLADGLVFHKPGAVWTRPFAVMTIDQVLDVYFQATDYVAVRRKAR